MRINLRRSDAGVTEEILGFLQRPARIKLVESNVLTTLNASAGAGILRVIPLVGDYGRGLVLRRSGPSRPWPGASI